jgi:hypothetical protein
MQDQAFGESSILKARRPVDRNIGGAPTFAPCGFSFRLGIAKAVVWLAASFAMVKLNRPKPGRCTTHLRYRVVEDAANMQLASIRRPEHYGIVWTVDRLSLPQNYLSFRQFAGSAPDPHPLTAMVRTPRTAKLRLIRVQAPPGRLSRGVPDGQFFYGAFGEL